jgi:predicted outer membrane repeat protein
MKQIVGWLVVVLCLAFSLAPRAVYAGNAVVGNGSPASCTEAAFDAALATASNGGGTITFNCGPTVKTINFTVSKFLTLGNVTIDGENRIMLKAGNAERHFFAGPVTFRLRNITLREGDSLVSGGAIEASGAQVIVDNVQFLSNRSSVTGGAIYCYDGSLTVRNSRFENNSADTAGAIFNDGCTVELDTVTFRNNRAIGSLGRGGAVENAPLGALTVRNSRFETNSALDGGGLFVAGGSTATLDSASFVGNSGGYGGGIENSGDLTLTNSLFQNNTVTGSGGGLWNIDGTAQVQRTTFSGNTAYEGGGVNSYGRSLELRDVNLIDNRANGSHGGGLYHAGGTAFIHNATISGNRANDAAGNGGGVYQNSDDNLVLTNVTLANNWAGGFGGGLYHYSRYAILTNVTITDNNAGLAGAAIYEDAPMTPGSPGVIQLTSSVIAGSANNCDGPPFQSLGYNISRGTCSALDHLTDRENYSGSLLLGPLAFNGGAFAMNTRLPQAGSPLINAGNAALCTPLDQRGAPRVGVCDIGSVEFGVSLQREVYLPLLNRTR